MSLVAEKVLSDSHEHIYNDEWRERLRGYLADRQAGYWAHDFDRAWSKHQRGIRKELDLARRVSYWLDLKGARVLVMGSYLGTEAIAYALCGAQVVGIDLDPRALALSEDLARQHGVEIEARCMDAVQTEFADASFDYISCAQVLEHLPPEQQPQLLGEIWRLCKPGGLFWLDTPNQLSYMDQHDTGLPFIHWLPRALKVPLARLLGRSVPYPEPAFGPEPIHLHYYTGYFRLLRILNRLGGYQVLTRYRGYADADHYCADRQHQGRTNGRAFAAKVALLRLSLRFWNWNWFSGIRLMVRKVSG